MTTTLCLACMDGGSHLDLTTPSEILPQESLDKDFYKIYRQLWKYYSDRNYDNKRRYQLAAITLTLSPVEQRAIKQMQCCPINFLKNKMETLKIVGIFIPEKTKRGVIHLHGFTIVDTSYIYNHKCRLGYYLPEWKASNVIKLLNNLTSIDRWYNYCTKTLITADIISWLQ